jgi:hypothetical protein
MISSGCGQQSANPVSVKRLVSRHELVRIADAACRGANERLISAAQASEQFGDVYAEAAIILRDASAELRGLIPPRPVAASFTAFEKTLAVRSKIAEDLARRARRGARPFRPLVLRSVRQQIKARKLARTLGFRECPTF